MKTYSKRLFAAVLALLISFSFSFSSFASGNDLAFEASWQNEGENGVILFPGSNETEMNFSWYSSTESTPKVIMSKNITLSDSKTFSGVSVSAPDGDYANKVTATGLEAGERYFYKCVSGDFESAVYTFSTDENPNEFSALYTTDIHVSYDSENESTLKNTASKLNGVINEANLRTGGLSLVLSAGDQASLGLEKEYKAFSATVGFKSIPVATSIGNHDRKGIAYKTFNNVPNEKTNNLVSSYVGSDYWFTKGDVLFLVMDSNNGSGIDHSIFIREAIKANPDAKWRIMMFHHDLYSGRIPHRESENEILRLLWGPIADEFKIDLVLLGHSHYYTVTNVMYNNKSVQPYSQTMTDPAGTVFMVSGSINRPRQDDKIGLSENVGFDYLTEEPIYNIIDFSEDSITVSSYTKGSANPFNSFSIVKTSDKGGHPDKLPPIYNGFVRAVGTVYAFFNNIGVYQSLKDNGYDVSFFDVVFSKK